MNQGDREQRERTFFLLRMNCYRTQPFWIVFIAHYIEKTQLTDHTN